MNSGNGLGLTVQVDAAEWAYAMRRVTYLSAMMSRILQDDNLLSEWFTGSQLVALRLPSMPLTKSGIAQKAAKGNWVRSTTGDDREIRYHVASLPARAFDSLVGRLLRMPEVEDNAMVGIETLVDPSPAPAVLADNAAPAWVLPLMRLMKGEAQGNLGAAWSKLPTVVPRGVTLPTVEEAASVLVGLGITGR